LLMVRHRHRRTRRVTGVGTRTSIAKGLIHGVDGLSRTGTQEGIGRLAHRQAGMQAGKEVVASTGRSTGTGRQPRDR
jgi:hypothetical protein